MSAIGSTAPAPAVRDKITIIADLLERKRTHFVLWHARITATAPQLIIGQFQAGNPPTLGHEQQLPLRPVPGFRDLWEIPAADCHLTNAQVYHYWFEVE